MLEVFNPTGAATWVLTEPVADDDESFGMRDLGTGRPNWGLAR